MPINLLLEQETPGRVATIKKATRGSFFIILKTARPFGDLFGRQSSAFFHILSDFAQCFVKNVRSIMSPCILRRVRRRLCGSIVPVDR